MKLFLVRHPKPNVETGLCYGEMDVPLADGWEIGAQALQIALPEVLSESALASGKTLCFHSPLTRAAQLADFISHQYSVPVKALQELSFGKWEGRLWKDIPRDQIDLWANDIVHSAPYEGESLQVVADRVWAWWLSIKDLLLSEASNKKSVEHCVLVAHSGVIKVLVSLLCEWPLAQCHRIDVGFTSLTEFSIQGDYLSLKRLGAGDWVPST